MVAKNDITGDSIQTKGTSEAYRDNYDLIFRKKTVDETEQPQTIPMPGTLGGAKVVFKESE